MLEREESRLCAACGASNSASAGFCGVCGATLLAAVPLEAPSLRAEMSAGGGWPEPLPLLPGESPLPGERVEEPAAAVAQKRCSWCSAMNPWTAAVCESCSAHFPVPEQDEAFRRASEQRVQSEEARVVYLRERRLRRNNWGFLLRRFRFW